MAEKNSREKAEEEVRGRGGEAGTEKAIEASTMERSFGVKIRPAAIRSRGEVGIAAGEFRSMLFAQTSSLSSLPPARDGEQALGAGKPGVQASDYTSSAFGLACAVPIV